MPLFGLKGSIDKTARDFETSSLLCTIWVKVHGVLDLAREVDVIKEIMGLVVEPLIVDELSLIKSEPVRVQVRCWSPASIRGSIEIFFNGVGKMISFEVEGGKQGGSKGGKGGPPRASKPDDRKDFDRDKHQQDDMARKSLGKFDRIEKLDREMESGYEEAMKEEVEKSQGDKEASLPLAGFHPVMGMVSVTQISSLRTSSAGGVGLHVEQEKPAKVQTPSESQIIVHGRDGPYLMDKAKWPVLTLVEE